MHLGSKSKECLRSHIIATNMRSEGFFTYSRGAYTNFLYEERKMRRLFFARKAYSTHFTRCVEKKIFLSINENRKVDIKLLVRCKKGHFHDAPIFYFHLILILKISLITFI